MATGREMVASFVLRLRDGVSTQLAGLQRRLAALSGMAQRVGLGFGVLAGLSFLGPIQQAAAFEDVLRQNAITAGRSGQAAEAMIRQTQGAYERLALATGQYSKDIAEAAGVLVAANLPQELIDQFLPVLAKTATAAGASLNDLSGLAVALNQNLEIKGPQEMADALGALAVAGKEGRFELRDMAREFPALTAGVANLGLKGREAVNSLGAMLQVARRGAGSSSEAANNLANFLQKITSPETVKNFKAQGVDLEAVLKDAAKKGINPVEAVVAKIREVTGGNAFKMGGLFGDIQALNLLKALLPNVAEYRKVLEQARQANDSIINQDAETRMKGLRIRLLLVDETLTQIGRHIQLAFGGVVVEPLLKGLSLVNTEVQAFLKNYPNVTRYIIVAGLAAAAFVAALGLLGVAAAAVSGGFMALAAVFGVVVGVAKLAVLGFTAVAAVLGTITLPMALAVAGAVALAYAGKKLYDNWGGVTALIKAVGHSLGEAADFFINAGLDWVARSKAAVVGGIKAGWGTLTGFVETLWAGITARFDAFLAWGSEWVGRITATIIAPFKAAWSALSGFFDGLWSGITARFDAALAPIIAAIERIKGLLGGGLAVPALPAAPPSGAPSGPALPRRDGKANTQNFYRPSAATGQQQGMLRGKITVAVEGQARVREVKADKGLDLAGMVDRGPMLGRA